jgi:hypothetical protein
LAGACLNAPRAARELITLKDAGTYITKLQKAEHEAPEWQAAVQALILVATKGGPTMLARTGIMQALNRHVERADLESVRGISRSAPCIRPQRAKIIMTPAACRRRISRLRQPLHRFQPLARSRISVVAP